MKELFSKAKLGKLRNFLWVLLIIGCKVIYLQFIVVPFYDIGLFIVSIQNSPSFVDTALLLPLHKKRCLH